MLDTQARAAVGDVTSMKVMWYRLLDHFLTWAVSEHQVKNR